MATGVLIFEGMTVGILPGDFVVSTDELGAVESKLILSTAYNVIPTKIFGSQDFLTNF